MLETNRLAEYFHELEEQSRTDPVGAAQRAEFGLLPFKRNDGPPMFTPGVFSDTPVDGIESAKITGGTIPDGAEHFVTMIGGTFLDRDGNPIDVEDVDELPDF